MTTVRVDTAERGLWSALQAILADGEAVPGGSSLSIGSGRSTRELCELAVVIARPRHRLIALPGRTTNVTTAIARLVWLLAGSDRARDIAFYDQRALAFSDDGETLAGSNFGQRIFAPSPGVNQFTAVLQRLRADPTSRRAAIAIYRPDDAVRESRDIPCALATTYRIRGGALHATTLMRSSNLLGLFPYDFFEFSMLAEMMACALGVPLGTVTHHASSAHFYEDDLDAVRALVDHEISLNSPPMPAMPADPSPLDQARALVALEWTLRHTRPLDEVMRRADAELCDYWFQFFAVLALFARPETANLGLRDRIGEPLRRFLKQRARP